jgi:hypothetical protein
MIRHPTPEKLEPLISIVGQPTNKEALAEDEHARYALYVAALEAALPSADGMVLEIIRDDPDRAMSEAAVVNHIDRVARRHISLSEFRQWLLSRSPFFRDMAFAARRSDEWHLFKEISEGQQSEISRLSKATDWLQRKVATEINDIFVLGLLATGGRTRRIRNTAAQRLRTLRG